MMPTCIPLFAASIAAPFAAYAATPPVTRPSSIAEGMQWIGKAVDDPAYYVWCTSPISDGGKIHLFCSRWPKELRMEAWATHSEIAHYVGDKPEGPFHLSEVAMAANPGAPFNNTIHNPAIFKFGDRYALLYSTFEYRKGEPGEGRMCTCLATSDKITGPWKREGDNGLIVRQSVDPGHWTYRLRGMSNPTMLYAKGKYYIYFKSGGRGARYGYAVSDKLSGPYVLSDKPCTDNIDYIEDGTAFAWNGKYYLLTNDNFGTNTGRAGQGILWESDTPEDFKLSNAKIGFFLTSVYAKGVDFSKARKLYGNDFKFERPGILMLDGKPAYFYGPSGVNLAGDDHTCSYVMKINPNR